MYDPEKILSWTKREFDALIKGWEQADIDKRDFESWRAMAHRYAQSAKHPRQKKIFDAERIRNNNKHGFAKSEEEIEEMARLNRSAKGFDPRKHSKLFQQKGGST
ncbi:MULTISPECIES: hypothetical protein [Salimicrobium]|uniref:hypothetical protein n=1 Tax=Salimicrobium TaxID=351195 RepID=UPI000B847E7C|nr:MULTISPECIES: hypothetical protein [Salimicrobium]